MTHIRHCDQSDHRAQGSERVCCLAFKSCLNRECFQLIVFFLYKWTYYNEIDKFMEVHRATGNLISSIQDFGPLLMKKLIAVKARSVNHKPIVVTSFCKKKRKKTRKPGHEIYTYTKHVISECSTNHHTVNYLLSLFLSADVMRTLDSKKSALHGKRPYLRQPAYIVHTSRLFYEFEARALGISSYGAF